MYFEICNKKHCLINLRNISLQFQALIAKMILKQDLPKNCDSRVLHKICIFLANDLDSNEFDNFKWLWQLPTRCHAHSHHSAHLWGYLRFAGSFFSNLCIQVAAKGSEQQTLMMTIKDAGFKILPEFSRSRRNKRYVLRRRVQIRIPGAYQFSLFLKSKG